MKLLNIYDSKKEQLKVTDKINYFKSRDIGFLKEPEVDSILMFSCNDGKIYKTPKIVNINIFDNYIILETENMESYIFKEDIDEEN